MWLARITQQRASAGIALAAMLAFAGCDALGPSTSLTPKARPQQAAVPIAQPVSVESAALGRYFRQVQSAQLTQGLLRTEGGAADTPFDADQLARNFEQIAFYSEYASNFSSGRAANTLSRWNKPVRLSIIFGAGIPQAQQAKDTANIRDYAKRLTNVTGHSITVSEPANFFVVIVGEDNRAATLQKLVASTTALYGTSVDNLINLPRSTYCAVIGYETKTGRAGYSSAIALIRAENPGLLRLSCIHEELAQGLGLPNDSPAARPSIFNDDDEFALLTTHDELLLSMLYDPRLKQGMTADQARPIARIIARDLMGQEL